MSPFYSLWLALLLLLAPASVVVAHPMVENMLEMRVLDVEVRMEVQVSLEEILVAQEVKAEADGGYDAGALSAAAQQHRGYLTSHLFVEAEGRALPLQATRVVEPVRFGTPHSTHYYYTLVAGRAGSGAETVQVRHEMLREHTHANGSPWQVSYVVRRVAADGSLAQLAMLRRDAPVTVPTRWKAAAAITEQEEEEEKEKEQVNEVGAPTSGAGEASPALPRRSMLMLGLALMLLFGAMALRRTKLRHAVALLLAMLGALATPLPCEAQQKKIYLAPDDHTDFIWSDSEANYHTHFLNMLDYHQAKVDETATNAPDYRQKFTIDGTLWLETYAANRTPAQFDALMQKVKDGHITVPLAPLCISYGVMPSEAVLRGMYYNGRLERRYNMRFRLGQAMENATMALGVGSLWSGSGAKYVWQGICGCDTQLQNLNQRVAEMYLWRGRDGSSLLTKWYSLKDNQNVGGYAEGRVPHLAVDWVTTQAASNGFALRHPWPIIGVFGQGWDDLATMNLNFVNAAPGLSDASRRVIVSNEIDFFEDFEANHGAPALDELSVSYGNEWDTYCASMAEVSARVKRSVEKLRGAEAMATLVSLQQPAFMQGRISARDLAFQDMSLYFEHDFTGVDNPFVNERTAWQRRIANEIEAYVNPLHDDARAALGGLIAKTGTNTRFMVFNPLSWARTDVADFAYTGSAGIRVVEVGTGTEAPFQIVDVDGVSHLRVWAENVPAVGYKVFEIQAGTGAVFNNGPTADAGTGVMSNARYQLTMAPRGAITSLVDLTRANREYAAVVNGRAMNDLGAGTDGTVTVENAGPVSITLKTVSTTVMNHTTRVTLYRGGDRVDIRNDITQNFGGDPTWGYGFNIASPNVWHEEVGAVIRARLTNNGGHYSNWNARYDYLTLNHFADMTGAIGGLPAGITLSNADCFIFQLGTSGVNNLDTSTPSINPVIGSDNNRIFIQDTDSYFLQRFAVQTHDSYDQTAAMKFSLEHQNPFITAAVTGGESSPYPAGSYSYVTINDPKVLLWSLKPHEDGIDRGVVARVWNQGATSANLNLTVATGGLANARKATHIETDDVTLTVSGGALVDSVPAQKMQTYVFNRGLVENPVAAPTFAPPGGTFAGSTNVSLATFENGATIRYTLDGSTPTATHGTVYAGSFAVPHSTTVKAVTITTEEEASVVSSAAFTITGPANVMGHNGGGNLWDLIADGSGSHINASLWQAPASFTATSIKAHVMGIAGGYRCAIYADNGGTPRQPAALLGTTAEVETATDGWQTFALGTPVALTAGNHYWLCIWAEVPNSHIRAIDSGGTVRYPQPANYTYGATWPEPLVTNQQYNYKQCIYADGGPSTSLYDQWKQGHGLPAATPPLDDADGDFVPLLIEYALDMNPHALSVAALPVATVSGGLYSVTFLRARSDLSYTVQTSTDLNTWTAVGITQATGPVGTFVTATMPQTGGETRFFRLRVQEM